MRSDHNLRTTFAIFRQKIGGFPLGAGESLAAHGVGIVAGLRVIVKQLKAGGDLLRLKIERMANDRAGGASVELARGLDPKPRDNFRIFHLLVNSMHRSERKTCP